MIEIVDEMMIVIVILQLVIKILVDLNRNHQHLQKIVNHLLVHHLVHLHHPILDQVPPLHPHRHLHLHHPVHRPVVHQNRMSCSDRPEIILILFSSIENLQHNLKNVLVLHLLANGFQHHPILTMNISSHLWYLSSHENNRNANRLRSN